jgi:hypothetical protein
MIKPFKTVENVLSPKVVLNKEANIFLISGKSIVENAHLFFSPIIEWFTEYLIEPNKITEINIYLEYLNSSSALQITKLFNLLSKQNNSNIKFIWFYESGDDIMREIGEDFKTNFDIDLSLKIINQKDKEKFKI